jgi:hypothetical protein
LRRAQCATSCRDAGGVAIPDDSGWRALGEGSVRHWRVTSANGSRPVVVGAAGRRAQARLAVRYAPENRAA